MKPKNDLSTTLGKLPPQAIDLEQAICGAVMLEKDALAGVLEIGLKPEHFYLDSHQQIFNACITLFLNSNPIDMRTVVSQLRKDGHLEPVGGAHYIVELTGKVSSAANVSYHAAIIIEKALARELIHIGTEIHQQAYNDTTDVFELIDASESKLLALRNNISKQKQAADALTLYQQSIQSLKLRSSHNGLSGVPTGFIYLNNITSGWQPSDLIIIAGRPGMGKTAFMLRTMREPAGQGIPVAIFSLEMSAQQLQDRLLSIEHSIENDRIRSGKLLPDHWERLSKDLPPRPGITSLHQSKYFIDDTASLSINEFRAKAKRLHAKHGVKLIVVDYLQLMRGEKTDHGNRDQEVGSITRGLKQTAKELNIPIIALSSLSRSVETRGGHKRPMLSDLRESGNIEQDADMVCFLYRPEYYNIPAYEDGSSTAGAAEIIIAKHRNGSLDTIKIKYEAYYTRFEDTSSVNF